MITHQNGLLGATAPTLSSEPEANREREQLRRELLERIINRETRRQATRGESR
ncbi:MAG: hypothetical protein HQ464_14720 [Planctomycetes bacterium]|nr:hypothetical protein [Planctomycetota bacterium]